jgi:cell division protein FtsL
MINMANKVARKKRKLQNKFRGERVIYFTLALILLAIPVCNVYTKAILSETNIALEEIKSDIKEQEKLNESLRTEIDVLASYDAMQQIATENGLSYHNDNIKVVTSE